MNKLINPILFIMCLLAMACSDDNNENETFAPFSLEKRYYEVRLERNATSIPIINGSGDISLAIEDDYFRLSCMTNSNLSLSLQRFPHPW